MKAKKIIIFTLLLVVLIGTTVSADERFSITSAYVTPIGNDKIDSSLSVGMDYRFWGVFQFSLNMYNSIVLGADNILNIRKIKPIGLFSGGVGMKIPLGGFHFLIDWQKFFTGTAGDEGVFPFSDSYAYGVSLDISDFFGIEVSRRQLYNFSEQAIQDPGLRIDAVTDTVDTLSIGVAFHLF
ncbi:MAG: hypothetical protein HN368_15830 [Spirochaetales bacterium]|nr:hypothetical protein [Spirochaetales bacterium]